MNTIRRAAFAASALAITLVGAVLVTAPMAFARPEATAGQQACAAPSSRLASAARVPCNSAGSDAGLVAFNGR
jgi:hypothetical protein